MMCRDETTSGPDQRSVGGGNEEAWVVVCMCTVCRYQEKGVACLSSLDGRACMRHKEGRDGQVILVLATSNPEARRTDFEAFWPILRGATHTPPHRHRHSARRLLICPVFAVDVVETFGSRWALGKGLWGGKTRTRWRGMPPQAHGGTVWTPHAEPLAFPRSNPRCFCMSRSPFNLCLVLSSPLRLTLPRPPPPSPPPPHPYPITPLTPPGSPRGQRPRS